MNHDGAAEFARLIEALRPALGSIVIAGGWAHRLHRLAPTASRLAYPPLATEDADIVVARDHSGRAPNLRDRLRAAGFVEEFSGDARPPVTYYQLGSDNGGFYAEFLTPLRGGLNRRDGSRDETAKIQGVNAQKLRHLDLLLVEPWTVEISQQTGFPLNEAAQVLVPNPVAFIVQKLLVHFDRKPEKRPADVLYIHDTILTFGEQLDDLSTIWSRRILPALSDRTRTRLSTNQAEIAGSVNDTIRTAARIVPTRNLNPAVVQRVCEVGLATLLRRPTR